MVTIILAILTNTRYDYVNKSKKKYKQPMSFPYRADQHQQQHCIGGNK